MSQEVNENVLDGTSNHFTLTEELQVVVLIERLLLLELFEDVADITEISHVDALQSDRHSETTYIGVEVGRKLVTVLTRNGTVKNLLDKSRNDLRSEEVVQHKNISLILGGLEVGILLGEFVSLLSVLGEDGEGIDIEGRRHLRG